MTINGRVTFAADAAPFDAATLRAWLEDTTYADAPAIVIAESIVRGVTLARVEDSIAFRLVVDPQRLTPGRRRTVRVLVDLDGDATAGRGDYVNAHSVPVRGGAGEIALVVPVTRV